MSYLKDKLIDFSEEESKNLEEIHKKSADNLLPEEKKFIEDKYNELFGRLRRDSINPLYVDVSNLLLMPVFIRGGRGGLNPLIAKKYVLKYAMDAPKEMSNEDYNKKIENGEVSAVVYIRIYNQQL